MVLKWSQVVEKDEFKALPDAEKESARQEYFNSVVAPNVPPEDLESVRGQFDEDTSLRVGALDTAGRIASEVGSAAYYHLPAAISAMIEGDDPYAKRNVLDNLIERSNAKTAEQSAELERKTAIPGVSTRDIASLGPSLAFSTVGMGAGAGAAIPAFAAGSLATPIAGTVAGYSAGAAASGTAAYRMSTNQFVRQLREEADQDSVERTGKPLSDQEFNEKMTGLKGVISEYGLWEAVPEAAGNVLGYGILSSPVKGAIGKIFGKNVVKRAAGKLMALYGGELSTETATQQGQFNVSREVDAINKADMFKDENKRLRQANAKKFTSGQEEDVDFKGAMEGEPNQTFLNGGQQGYHSDSTPQKPRSWTSPSDLYQSLKEVAPATLLQTTLLGGGTKLSMMARDRVQAQGLTQKQFAAVKELADLVERGQFNPEQAQKIVIDMLSPTSGMNDGYYTPQDGARPNAAQSSGTPPIIMPAQQQQTTPSVQGAPLDTSGLSDLIDSQIEQQEAGLSNTTVPPVVQDSIQTLENLSKGKGPKSATIAAADPSPATVIPQTESIDQDSRQGVYTTPDLVTGPFPEQGMQGAPQQAPIAQAAAPSVQTTNVAPPAAVRPNITEEHAALEKANGIPENMSLPALGKLDKKIQRAFSSGWADLTDSQYTALEDYSRRVEAAMAKKPTNKAQAPAVLPTAQQPAIPPSPSYVVVDKQTGDSIMETFERKTAEAINREKYDVLPAKEYLEGLNQRGKESGAVQQNQPIVNTPAPFTTEQTAAGEQAVLQGAERISDRELAERRMEGASKAKVAQKAADDGLFDVGARSQTDLMDMVQAPQKTAQSPISQEGNHRDVVTQLMRERGTPMLDLNRKPTGWIQHEIMANGAPSGNIALIHPTENIRHEFTSGYPRAGAEAQSFAIDNPVTQTVAPKSKAKAFKTATPEEQGIKIVDLTKSRKGQKKAAQKKPLTLLQFIAKNGGINDSDIADIGKVFVPGYGRIASKGPKSKSADDMTGLAWDAGYFGMPAMVERPTPVELSDLVERSISGQKHYSEYDRAANEDISAADKDALEEDRQDMLDTAERYGIDTKGKTDEQIIAAITAASETNAAIDSFLEDSTEEEERMLENYYARFNDEFNDILGEEYEQNQEIDESLAEAIRNEPRQEAPDSFEGEDQPSAQSRDERDQVKRVAAEGAKEVGTKKQQPTSILTKHQENIDRLYDGEMTADEARAAFKEISENEEAIKAELNKKTMKELSPRNLLRLPKPKLVNSIYRDMLSDYIVKSFSWDPFSGTYQDAIAKQIEKQTDADIKEIADKRKARMDETKQAIEDPKTLSDFSTYMRLRRVTEATLPPELKARYDELIAQRNKEARARDEEKKSVVKAVDVGDVDMEIVETKHTQKGHDLFVVKLSDKLPVEKYRELVSRARQLGGYYSSYRRDGAVPGFQFKTREEAEKFTALKEGDVSKADVVSAKKEEAKLTAAQRLQQMADEIDAKADESMNRDRLTNTAKRARQAGYADDEARAQKALAQTMRNIASAIEDGNVKHLDGIRSKAAIETLESLLRRSHYDAVRQKMKETGENYEKLNAAPFTEAEVDKTTYPYPHAHRDNIRDVAEAVKDRSGFKRLAAQALKDAEEARRRDIWQIEAKTQADQERLIEIAKEAKRIKKEEYAAEMILKSFEDYKRLQAMGLTDLPSLRAALREYLQYRGKKSEKDRVKELERGLIGQKVGIDFFPTPKVLSERMAEIAGIGEGARVLEPSAGNGNIADALRETGATVEVAEISKSLRDILEAKGYQIVSQDFMDIKDGGYDAVVMNPPFSNNQDIEHVRHAYDLVKDGGKVVAIVGEGAFFRQSKTETAFRDWLDELGAEVETLPQGTFQDKKLMNTTGANARLVTITKGGQSTLSLAQNTKQTDSKAFKDWFGDSKVVDDYDNPLVVYHGSPDARFMKDDAVFRSPDERYSGNKERGAFWFASDKGTANSYADDRRAFDYQNAEPEIVAAYLKMENPLVVNAGGKEWREAQARGKTSDVIEQAKAEGRDGVIIKNVRDNYNNNSRTKSTDTYVVFKSEQIKSATNNKGTFDPQNPSILAQSTGKQTGSLKYVSDLRSFERFAKEDGKSNDIHETIGKYLLEKGKGTGNEYAVVYDATGNKIIDAFTNNDQNEIPDFGTLSSTAVKTGDDSIVIHHNHPKIGNISYPLSLQDIWTLGNLGVRGIIAHHHDGGMSGARLTPEARQLLSKHSPSTTGRSRQSIINDAYKAAKTRISNGLLTMVSKKELSRSDADQAIHHMVNLALDDAGIIDYNTTQDYPSVRTALKGKLEALVSEAAADANQKFNEARKDANNVPKVKGKNGDIRLQHQPVLYKDGVAKVTQENERIPSAAKGAGVLQRGAKQPYSGRAEVDQGPKGSGLNLSQNNANDLFGEKPKTAKQQEIERIRKEAFAPRPPKLPLEGGANGSNASWDAPEPTALDSFIQKVQNKLIDLKRAQDAIEEVIGTIHDSINPYVQEELYHGRVAKRVQDFSEIELKGLTDYMAANKIEIATLEEYLHALHAPEANKLIADRNPEIPEGGSGMTDEEAAKIIASKSAEEKAALDGAAKMVRNIIDKTNDAYVDYGLISKKAVDQWRGMFKHYIPLMRDDDGVMGTGSGFSIRGKEVKHRTGSTKEVVNILGNIALQREKVVVRGEKNRVGLALAGLVALNPNPDFWSLERVPEPVYNEKTGLVDYKVVQDYKDRPNVIAFKVKDKNGDVVERAVIFNRNNPRALRLAMALKNLDVGDLEGFWNVAGQITRYFSAINTNYNPAFGPFNLLKDVQSAAINLSNTELAGSAKAILNPKRIGRNVKEIYKYERARRKGKAVALSEEAKMWEELQDEGGMTGFRDMYKTSGDRAKAIQRQLTPNNWKNSSIAKVIDKDGNLTKPIEVVQKAAGWIGEWLSDYNQTLEAATRLSVYMEARKKGLSKTRAASLAKNATVNFNRRGAWGAQIGSWYAFFNASMQGTARMGQTLLTMKNGDIKTLRVSSVGKKIIAGGMLLGAMQAVLNAFAFDDDDDPPQFVRERNLVIPLSGGHYATFPLPLGYNLIFNLGRIPAEWAISGGKNTGEHISRILSALADTYNPIGSSSTLGQTFAPTILDPFMAISENKDWTGRPIAKEDFNKLAPTPGFTRAKDNSTVFSKVVAEAINTLTFGDDYTKGFFSPTPDQLDYLIGQATGGAGRTVMNTVASANALVTDAEIPLYKIPIAGRLIGKTKEPAAVASAYYRNVEKMNVLKEVFDNEKDPKVREKYKKQNPEWVAIPVLENAEKAIKDMKKYKKKNATISSNDEEKKRIDDKITETMMKVNDIILQAKKRKDEKD